MRSHWDLIKWSLHWTKTGTSYSWTIGGSFLSWISLRWIVLDSSETDTKQRRSPLITNNNLTIASTVIKFAHQLVYPSQHFYNWSYWVCQPQIPDKCQRLGLRPHAKKIIGTQTAKYRIPIGNVQAPVAFSSSNKVNMMGKSFCLLSSLDMKPLSSCNTATGNEITHHIYHWGIYSCQKHCMWQGYRCWVCCLIPPKLWGTPTASWQLALGHKCWPGRHKQSRG